MGRCFEASLLTRVHQGKELTNHRSAGAVQDAWIDTGYGRLFTRSWQPSNERVGTDSRSPIVLFHDSLGCIALWRNFPALLAGHTGRTIIAYDRLGFGQSNRRTDRLSLDFIQEEAQRFFPLLRAQLKFDRFIAFGHSVGGGIAAYCAAMYPSCEALITESAQAFVEDRTRRGILDAQASFQEAESRARLRRYHGDKTDWVSRAWIETWLSPAFADWSLREILPQVRCPTLVIHGSDDEYGSRRHAELIANSVSGPAQLESWLARGMFPIASRSTGWLQG